MEPKSIPTSVYRLQLDEHFPLKKAIEVLPYLKELGVEAVYCSPFYDAYSAHGYDVTDPNRLNPKLGTEEEFRTFCSEIKRLGLKQIIDVVPNHMGIKGGKNKWWQDVLEKGSKSEYACFFDINWNPEKQELKERVLLPILGAPYGQILDKHEIKLEGNQLRYGDFPLPLAEETLGLIEGEQTPDFFDRLLEAQHYRLAYWRVASHEINYRRFFNIHELVAIRIEEPKVLEAHHKWLFELIEAGHVHGMRIDHPDGLYDPVGYFETLRKKHPLYTIVEKILDREEELPSDWQVEGTVGYESINVLNGLFIDRASEPALDSLYKTFIGEPIDFEESVYQSKKLFAYDEMVSEVEALGLALDRLSEKSRDYRDFTRFDLTRALAELIACFPVYRTYIAPEGDVTERDRTYITAAIAKAKERAADLDPSIFDFLEKVLLLQLEGEYRDFVLRFQQLTGPMMAKGLEDTAFYRYNRFLSLNEVGGDPTHFGYTLDDFHAFNREKQKHWPYGFIASSTHDTKRSEDVRQRLNVLSEMPERWGREVNKWKALTAKHKQGGPTPNTEYFIYQTLLGAWPRDFDSLWAVILKSMREAKEETSWMFPNHAYESSVEAFLKAILSDRAFLEPFEAFQREVDRFGALNSLSATVVKAALCGVVDIYQGCERLHYTLVDPDNRSPVDFELRKQELEMVKNADPVALYRAGEYSLLKTYLLWKALSFRQENAELFLDGEYFPVEVRGANKEHVIAFGRRHKEQILVVLAGRFFSTLGGDWGDLEIDLPDGYRWTDLFTGEEYKNAFAKLPMSYLIGPSID